MNKLRVFEAVETNGCKFGICNSKSLNFSSLQLRRYYDSVCAGRNRGYPHLQDSHWKGKGPRDYGNNGSKTSMVSMRE